MAHETGLAQLEAGKISKVHGMPLAHLAANGHVMVHGGGLAHFEARRDSLLHMLAPLVARGPGAAIFTAHGTMLAQFGASGSPMPQGNMLVDWIAQGMMHRGPQEL